MRAEKMSHFLQFSLLKRLGSLAIAMLLAPSMLIIPVTAQASPHPIRTGATCTGAEVLQPNDPDVQALRSLIDQYKISVPYAVGLGDRPITRYEFVPALNSALEQIKQKLAASKTNLSKSNLALIQNLLSKFENELTTLRSGNIFTVNDLDPYILADTTDVQTLRSLARKYGLDLFSFTRLPERSDFTRYEFAATLNNVLARINELIAKDSTSVSKADLQTLQKLRGFYSGELAELQKRIDALEERARGLEQQQFSSGTRLFGESTLEVQPTQPPVRQQTPIRFGNPVPATQPNVAPPASLTAPRPAPISNSPVSSNRNHADKPGVGSGRLAGEWIFHPPNTEGYNLINENPFLRPGSNPLSTFSIDVDTASYSNVRRFITEGQLPPKDAVRIEEMINYFPYDYPQPEGDKPFSITTDVAAAPWNPKHKLVQIGLKGKQLQQAQPSNLVFLVDVSGSMNEPNKLPLVKQSLCLLVNELSASDRVTLVVYAGNAGLVLPPTPGDQKQKIIDAIDKLEAGGSTAGSVGIELAYEMAQQNFLKNGNNRVILATDGDFNVGVSSDAELVRLIEQKRDRGIFLTVLGFGTGNYKDDKMEQLADKGNGNYAYIDTLLEAKKVLVNDLRGTLFAIAKDVKIQVEFNPAKVQAYRLIGYENRLLRDQDFNDDTKDAGEIGAGHTVTALYEVIPTGMESDVKLPSIDPLKYQQNPPVASSNSNELMQVKLRYKNPKDSTSQLISQPILDQPTQVNAASNNLKFSAAVVMFGMLLRDSEFKGATNVNTILQLANQAKGKDQEGYRSEFVSLVDRSKSLFAQQKGTENATTNPPQRNRL
jgi:Ca-activated chloride channel family protein